MTANKEIPFYLGHGRETYATYYRRTVAKRPNPEMTPAAREKWLAKQHRTLAVTREIRALNNPVYHVPEMEFINDFDFMVQEEYASGAPLTPELYANLTKRQQVEIVNGIANFLVDMNELKPVGPVVKHNISEDIKFARLDRFVENKMNTWFTASETMDMSRIRDKIGSFEYDTRRAWSHGDLNSGNVLYDPELNKLSFIDFAETDYHFIYHDIFGPTQFGLNIYPEIYKKYTQIHNSDLYSMPDINDPALREIMLNRGISLYLKRFIKASDDLRKSPRDDKSHRNNSEKIAYMRQQMAHIHDLQQQISL